ncbi:GNAT family N-acetyltransferase [Jannaschia sp. Os4]|uniref:GNAT family N-acetyltransferase n=1 Tax=Jannaschia sp. Os4 TaxID=2807617 RepID=UPI0019395651|nr:GNAT family N-acetyltransferase [Jannaschia sp. Os4]MBM2575473.1 GNAT family N-acetyltransferase [Jannaschia sp. Os4]
MTVEITRSDDPTEARRLRWTVFVEEQGIPVEAEMDGTDPGCTHWVLREDGAPVATLRTKVIDDSTLKIGRVATLAEARGRGHARRLMEAALAEARAAGLARGYLSAQEEVVGWYEAFGFVAEGGPYDDGGIPHRDMWADL